MFILVLSFLLCACYHRTEYGKKRNKKDFSKILVSQNDSIFKIIDTTKIYERVTVLSLLDNRPYDNFKKIYLKFYNNGRVGTFYYFDKDDIESINPKKADIGYYKFLNDDLIIQTYFEHPQGGGYTKDKLSQVSSDTLVLINEFYLDKYKAIPLPKYFLKFKPDW